MMIRSATMPYILLIGLLFSDASGQNPKSSPEKLSTQEWSTAVQRLQKTKSRSFREEHFKLALQLIREPALPHEYQVQAFRVLARAPDPIREEVHTLAETWDPFSFSKIAWLLVEHDRDSFPYHSFDLYVFSNPPREELRLLQKLYSGRPQAGQLKLFLLWSALLEELSRSYYTPVRVSAGLHEAGYLRQAAEAWVRYPRQLYARLHRFGIHPEYEKLRYQILKDLHGDRGKFIPKEKRLQLAGLLLSLPTNDLGHRLIQEEPSSGTGGFKIERGQRIIYWADYQRYAGYYFAQKQDPLGFGLRLEHTFRRITTIPNQINPEVSLLPDDLILHTLNEQTLETLTVPALQALQFGLKESPKDVRLILGLSRVYAVQQDLEAVLKLAPHIFRSPMVTVEILTRYLEQLEHVQSTQEDTRKIEETLRPLSSHALSQEISPRMLAFCIEIGAEGLLKEEIEKAYRFEIENADYMARIEPMKLALRQAQWEKVNREIIWMVETEVKNKSWVGQETGNPLRDAYLILFQAWIAQHDLESVYEKALILQQNIPDLHENHVLVQYTTELKTILDNPVKNPQVFLNKLQRELENRTQLSQSELRALLNEHEALFSNDASSTHPGWTSRVKYLSEMTRLTPDEITREEELFQQAGELTQHPALQQEWIRIIQKQKRLWISDYHEWPDWYPLPTSYILQK